MHEPQTTQQMPPNAKQLVDYFSRSFSAFQSSRDKLRVLCTLPHKRGGGGDDGTNPPSSRRPGGRVKRLVVVLCMMEAFARSLLAGRFEEEGVEVDVAVTTMPYFHDKARAIADSGAYHDEVAGEPEQMFAVGFDTLIRVFNPKYYGDDAEGEPRQTGMRAALGPFFECARLRVTLRPDDAWGGREEQLAYVRGLASGRLEELGGTREWAARVEVEDGQGEEEEVGVSSSRAREIVRRSGVEGLDGLVDGEVGAWIEREGLYRE
ncbi:hypothetical protein HIM_07474 [Hirsutella minnesotensis 3608]|uniref:Nicotinamide-nucleotide adenylyltransferase n=1 Tax=Hirsutella minnesotensis 3608 TaxID=1043627 RepID=A0A0F7ZN41_9HYPO|nr:hypothetical protein HIM_07474 [Hirsutella minnesotensis 3608]